MKANTFFNHSSVHHLNKAIDYNYQKANTYSEIIKTPNFGFIPKNSYDIPKLNNLKFGQTSPNKKYHHKNDFHITPLTSNNSSKNKFDSDFGEWNKSDNIHWGNNPIACYNIHHDPIQSFSINNHNTAKTSFCNNDFHTTQLMCNNGPEKNIFDSDNRGWNKGDNTNWRNKPIAYDNIHNKLIQSFSINHYNTAKTSLLCPGISAHFVENFDQFSKHNQISNEFPSKSKFDFQEEYYKIELKSIRCKIDELAKDRNLASNIFELIDRCRANTNTLYKQVTPIKAYTSSTNINSYKELKDDLILDKVSYLLSSFKSLVIELNQLISFSLFSTYQCGSSICWNLKELLNQIVKSNQKVLSKIKSRSTCVIIHQRDKAKEYRLFKSWLLSYIYYKNNLEKFIFNLLKTPIPFFKLKNKNKYEFCRINTKNKEGKQPYIR